MCAPMAMRPSPGSVALVNALMVLLEEATRHTRCNGSDDSLAHRSQSDYDGALAAKIPEKIHSRDGGGGVSAVPRLSAE